MQKGQVALIFFPSYVHKQIFGKVAPRNRLIYLFLPSPQTSKRLMEKYPRRRERGDRLGKGGKPDSSLPIFRTPLFFPLRRGGARQGGSEEEAREGGTLSLSQFLGLSPPGERESALGGGVRKGGCSPTKKFKRKRDVSTATKAATTPLPRRHTAARATAKPNLRRSSSARRRGARWI